MLVYWITGSLLCSLNEGTLIGISLTSEWLSLLQNLALGKIN
jgi:hypothetical protein